jgi:2'-5' RNA ligase
VSEPLRCFIAVKLPPEATESLREAQARLRAAEPGWKWVNPDTFHVTLKFLGQVERERLQATWQSVSEAIGGTEEFTLALRGLGVFPNLRAPRVAWAGISAGADELTALAAKAEEACSQHGFERERRPFAAHLTLGRAREPGPNSALAAVVQEFENSEFGGGPVDKVLLMQSTLRPTGAVYTVIGEQALERGETI